MLKAYLIIYDICMNSKGTILRQRHLLLNPLSINKTAVKSILQHTKEQLHTRNDIKRAKTHVFHFPILLFLLLLHCTKHRPKHSLSSLHKLPLDRRRERSTGKARVCKLAITPPARCSGRAEQTTSGRSGQEDSGNGFQLC